MKAEGYTPHSIYEFKSGAARAIDLINSGFFGR